MPDTPGKPPTAVHLVWEHDLVFAGRAGSSELRLDSASAAGPSPVEALAFALAGCMAMDVVHVLRKGRHDLRGLRADLSARRAEEPPKRFERVDLRFTIIGAIAVEHVERAIQLSRDKYCSVWHSMRADIEFDVSFTTSDGA